MSVSGRWDGCAVLARESEESLRGTAARADGWLLIEHRGPWGLEPLGPDGPLGRPGVELVRRCAASGVRPQLVRDPHRTREHSDVRKAFLVHSGRSGPWIEQYTFDTVDQLLELNVEAASTSTAPGRGTPVESPLYLVCTHGKKDPCCAVFGRPVALSLNRHGGRVWESTHLGGDRFAAGMVALPEGSYYGSLTPASAQALVDRHDCGQLTMEHYRGRCSDPPAVQIAEHAVRTRYGITGIDDVRPTAVTSSGVGQDVVVSTASGQVHVQVAPAPEAARRTTCRSLTTTVPDHGIVTFSESAFDAVPTC